MDTNGSAPTPRRRRTARPAAESAVTEPAVTEPAVAALQPDAAADAAPEHEEPASPTGGELTGERVETRAATVHDAPVHVDDGPTPADEDDEDDEDEAPGHDVRAGISMPEATLASLELHQGAIGRLDAQEVEVNIGAIGAARAEEIEVELGAVGAALANELEVSQGIVGTVVAGEARLTQVVARAVIARDVVVEKPSLIGFLLARRVRGDVRVLFDWRGALVFGVVFGLIARIGRGRGS